jgi:hypothetical protein
MELKIMMMKDITSWVIGRTLKPVLMWMDGKKTVTGAISLLLWVVIYALPAARPDLGYISAFGQQARECLEAVGVHLDQELLASGLGLTLVGLLHKAKKYFAADPVPAPNVVSIKRP